MARAERNILRFGRRLDGIGNAAWGGMRNAALAIGAVGGAILAANKSAANYADQIAKMSQKTGQSTEFLSRMRFAAEQADLEFDQLAVMSKGLNNALLDAGGGSKTAVDAFDSLGLSFEQIRDLSPDQRLMAVFEALTKVEDAGRRGALAQDLLGEAGQGALPLLADGYESLLATMAQADQFGLVIGPDQARAAAGFNDSITRLGFSFKGLLLQVSTFEPLTRAIDAIGQSINRLRQSGAFGAFAASIGNGVRLATEWIERFLLAWQGLSEGSRKQLLYIAGGLTAFLVVWRTGFLGGMLSALVKAVPYIFAHFNQIAAAGTALASFYIGLKIGNAIERSFDFSGFLLKAQATLGAVYDLYVSLFSNLMGAASLFGKGLWDVIVNGGTFDIRGLFASTGTNIANEYRKIKDNLAKESSLIDSMAGTDEKIGFWDALSEEFSAAGFAKDFDKLKEMLVGILPDGVLDLFNGMAGAQLDLGPVPGVDRLSGGIDNLSETIKAGQSPRLAGVERGSAEDFRATLARSQPRGQADNQQQQRIAVASERTANKLDQLVSLWGDNQTVAI
jgi:hypothetical protein